MTSPTDDTEIPTQPTDRARRGELGRAFDHLADVVLEGLRHGHFSYSLSCATGDDGRRHFAIRSGKSYKFTIPAHEL